MRNKKISFTIFLSVVIFSVAVISACNGEATPALVLSPEQAAFEPGTTTELLLSVVFTDTDGPDRKALKRFSEEPVISVSDPSFRLLSVSSIPDKNNIQTKIIVLASESMLSGSTALVNAAWGGLAAEAVLKIKKNPNRTINTDGVVTDSAAYDVLVNKQRQLPADYVPADLVRVKVPTILSFEEVNHLRQAASDALSTMFSAAGEEAGFELMARSGYRSYKTQVMLYDANVREYGEEYAKRISARPGTSEHQSGLAMDISSPVMNYQLDQSFGETPEGIWVAKNAHRFGFIVRYPAGKEDITGYDYEPWHLRWVGEQLAAELYKEGLALEEYFSD